MDSHPIAWGLDIGHATIKAVKLSRTGTGVTVLGYAIEPINVPESGDRELALANALQAIIAREEFGSTPVFAAISGRQVFTRPVNVPVLNPKRMHTMVELEAKQQIPGDFAEVEWGYHSSPAPDGVSLDVALFAVKREVIQQLISKCKAVGINLTGVSVPSLALYNFIKFDQEFPDGEAVIILDVGADNTDLVVYQGDQLWMRSLSTAGNDITQVFAKKFRVSVAEAETLKRQVTDSRQADKIIKVIESGLADLVSEINRNLGFYRSQNTTATLNNLVISGNTFRLPGLPEYMAEKLRLTINILEDLDRIQVAPGLDRTHFMQDLQGLGVAMGLALQATGVARANLNLIPSGVRTAELLAKKRWAAAAVIALLAGSIYVDYSVTDGIRETNEKLVSKVKKYVDDNNSRMKLNGDVLDKVQDLAPKLARFDKVGINQGLPHAVLAGVIGVVQAVAVDPALKPNIPSDQVETTPKLQAAYLRSVQMTPQDNPDPFQPLARKRTVEVKIDIPTNTRKDEVNAALLKALRTLPMPAYLQDLTRATSMFSEVQATNEVPNAIDWNFIDRGHLDASGSLKPILEQKTQATATLTYTCTVAADGGEAK